MSDFPPLTMRNQCKALLAISDAGKAVSVGEVAVATGLSDDQARSAVATLMRKRKVRRVYSRAPHGMTDLPGGGIGYLYEYCEEDVPLPDVVGKRGTPSQAAVKAQARPVADLIAAPKLVRMKVELLERMLPKAGGNDRDILLGIINDYKRLMLRKQV